MLRSPGLGQKKKSLRPRRNRRIYYEHANQRLKELAENDIIFREAETLSLTEVAKLLGCSKSTLSRWIKEGLVKAHKTATGRIYFLRSDFHEKTSAHNRVFNIDEVADKLSVVPQTVSKWIRCGLLSAYKIGKRWRIPESDLQDFIDCRLE
jgi:excisionase family DNA binding protein